MPFSELVAFSALTIPYSLASFETMQELYKNKTRQNSQNLPQARGTFLKPNTVHDLRHLQEYGCWCYFAEAFGQARGQPVNPYDEACKKYTQAVNCAMMDADIPNCDPKNQEYFMANDNNPNKTDAQRCTAANPNDACARTTCMIESWFIDLINREHILDENSPDYKTYSVSEGFDNRACASTVSSRIHDHDISQIEKKN